MEGMFKQVNTCSSFILSWGFKTLKCKQKLIDTDDSMVVTRGKAGEGVEKSKGSNRW